MVLGDLHLHISSVSEKEREREKVYVCVMCGRRGRVRTCLQVKLLRKKSF
jgi:hypothetical protein